MQHAVQAAEQLVRPVHRAPDIRGLGDVSGEDFHLGAQCDDLDEAGHPAPDAVLDGAFAGDDAGPLLARRQPVAGERVDVRGNGGHQSPSNTGARLAANASYARRKSFVCMQIACASASASIASSRAFTLGSISPGA